MKHWSNDINGEKTEEFGELVPVSLLS